MPDQIPVKLKHERAGLLIEEQSRVLRRINKKLPGREITVLMDTDQSGRTYADAPDIDGSVILTRPVSGLTGRFIKAVISKAEGYQKIAEPL